MAGRNEARDRCLLLLILRHGLRVSGGLAGLKFDQVDVESRCDPCHPAEARVIHGTAPARRRS
jgi:hypothetical protein